LGSVKTWYKKNQPRQLEKHREAYERDIEKIRQRDKERYTRDKPKRLELASEASQVRRARKKKAVVDKGISKLSLRKKLGDYCYYCGIEMDFSPAVKRVFKDEHATIEHLIPLSRGGNHTWENCVLACQACNKRKHAKTEAQWKEIVKRRKEK
jgi:5-methylcytosine-specific restriction endonuclease McrA